MGLVDAFLAVLTHRGKVIICLPAEAPTGLVIYECGSNQMSAAFILQCLGNGTQTAGMSPPDLLVLLYSREVSGFRGCTSLALYSFSCDSDYLAELSALPQTGIAGIESSIPLPGEYCTQESQNDQEESALYFLACISMRRLLNRVHDLLYARDTGVGFDNHQFPSVVSELGYQLEEWKDLLPFPFQFSADLVPTRTQEGAFLRQRYLTCKSVIYRPYLTWALSNSESQDHFSPVVYEGCRTCLEACCMHALNLRSLQHTIMVDTWICSLS